MRYTLLFLLSYVSLIASARDLFVVLYTSDAEVVDMYCETEEMNTVASPVVLRSVVLTRGSVNWHAVGGVPPYTDLRAERGPGGLVTVTVMDAACNTYTACGVVGVRRISKMVNCASDDPAQVAATPLPTSAAPRYGTAKSSDRTRTSTSGDTRMARPTNSRTTTTSASQRTAVRTQGPSRTTPRTTTPAAKSVTPAATRGR
jgi:hypothetical protein